MRRNAVAQSVPHATEFIRRRTLPVGESAYAQHVEDNPLVLLRPLVPLEAPGRRRLYRIRQAPKRLDFASACAGSSAIAQATHPIPHSPPSKQEVSQLLGNRRRTPAGTSWTSLGIRGCCAWRRFRLHAHHLRTLLVLGLVAIGPGGPRHSGGGGGPRHSWAAAGHGHTTQASGLSPVQMIAR